MTATTAAAGHAGQAHRVRLLTFVILALWSAATPNAGASPPPLLAPPVDAPLAAAFMAPASDFGAGHRGIDYAVAQGARVRAAADGTVTFAGGLPSGRGVTIEHDGGLVTTYTLLDDVYVERGEVVGRGTFIGAARSAHPGTEGLHFGVRLDGAYVDPLAYLGPTELDAAIHLVPTEDQDPASSDDDVLGPQVEGSTVTCSFRPDDVGDIEAPNDNIAVVVGGIDSAWSARSRPDAFAVPEALGYAPDRIYGFSYSGRDASYSRTDTYGDLRLAGMRLDELMQRIAGEHPGEEVDLLAHSQGGLVAREYLESWAEEWDGVHPTVEHVVTFSSPHQGAPLAGEIDDLERNSITGSAALDELAQPGGGLRLTGLAAFDVARFGSRAVANFSPDPHAVSVAQMAPGSDYLERLASEDVTLGARVLALQAPWDAIVPADHGRWPGRLNRVVEDAGLEQHNGILVSADALGLAHAFLRDAPEPCLLPDDVIGWGDGRAVAATEGALDWVYAGAERLGLARLGPLRGASWLYDDTVRGMVVRGARAGLEALRP